MADVVTLAEAKLHLRVTTTAEDDIITLYIGAAQEYIRNVLNRRIPGEDQTSPNIPLDIKQAALLIIGGMYEFRSDKIAGTSVENNPAVMNLLFPYRAEMGM